MQSLSFQLVLSPSIDENDCSVLHCEQYEFRQIRHTALANLYKSQGDIASVQLHDFYVLLAKEPTVTVEVYKSRSVSTWKP